MRQRLTVMVHGTRLHYIEAGTGPGVPLLLLHGLNGGCGWFDETLTALAPLGRVVAIDLPGWGETPPPPGFGYTMNELVAFTLAAMDALSLERVHLVGWSFGGCLAIHLAAAAPERIDHLVLEAPGGLTLETLLSWRLLCLHGLGEWLLRPTEANMRAGLAGQVSDVSLVPPAYLDYIYKAAQAPFFIQTTLHWARRNHILWRGARGVYNGNLLHRIQAPTAAIWGDADPIVPVRQSTRLAEIPGCRVHVLPGVGHIAHVEAPEPFNRWVINFLSAGRPALGADSA